MKNNMKNKMNDKKKAIYQYNLILSNSLIKMVINIKILKNI